jgi:hypothetical protein
MAHHPYLCRSLRAPGAAVGLALATWFATSAATVLAAAASTATWRPFSDGSPWNQRVAADARADPHSASLIDDFASRGPLHINIRDWSIPVYFVDADQTPKHAVFDSRPGVYGLGFEFPRAIPIPNDAIASPPVSDDSDNHLSIIDRAKNLEWAMWAARKNAAGEWGTGLGAVTDLAGTGVAPPWFASERELDSHRARAGGFPLIAGLVLVDEFKAGRIEHALCFAYDHCRGGFFVPPASTAQVTMQEMTNHTGIPMGGRIQLDPAWDVEHSALSPGGKIIARALQEYGAFCGDFAGANVLYAENSPEAVRQWEGLLHNEELSAVFTPEFIREHFRVIDMGNVLPGQNCEIPPPYVTAFNFSNGAEEWHARIDYFVRTIRVRVPAPYEREIVFPMVYVFPRSTRVLIAGTPHVNQESSYNLSEPAVLQLIPETGQTTDWTVIVEAPAW